MLIFALLAGALAIVLASHWMRTQSENSPTTEILVAAVDIPMGATLKPDMVKLSPWPQAARPEGAFSDPQAVRDRVILTDIQKGEPLMARRLAPEGSKGGLTAIVPPGKRAITVRVNDVIGVAGFALPGTYVDVMVNTEYGHGNSQQEAISKIVLERILVLAVAQDVERDATKPQVTNAVTLEVTPEQAEVLDLARSVGSLSLVLRNQTESQTASTTGVTKDALLGLRQSVASAQAPAPAPAATPLPRPAVAKAAPAAIAPPHAKDCVEIIRAGARSTECF
jgi:pilus assembly protein CpaB